MNIFSMEYRGYQIWAKPDFGCDQLWHPGYLILKDGVCALVSKNNDSASATREDAIETSVELAKIYADKRIETAKMH